MPIPIRHPRAWMPALLGFTMAAACSSERPADPVAVEATAPQAKPLRVKPAVDLASVVQRTALAYRWERGALAAGSQTVASIVTEDGALVVRPRRPEATPAGPPLAPAEGAPLSLSTARITRGARVLASGTAAPSLDRDGAVRIRRGDVTEHIVTDEGGVEQSWHFDRAPDGDGDLVVRVRASGERYVGRSDHGLHFSSGDGEALGLRYGAATWIDARGERTSLAPSFEAGEIVLRVPARVLETSRFPAVLDPTVTAEREMDQPISSGAAGGDQTSPSVTQAAGGSGFLGVWYDRRGVRPALYAARIASDGTVTDDAGVQIASSVSSAVPFVARANDGYLVVWSVPYADIYQLPGIYGVRLDVTGKPIDTAPFRIGPSEQNARFPTAAFDGSNWLVAWYRYGGSTSYDIAAARVPRQGAPLDAQPIAVSKDPTAEYYPTVTFDGTDHLVAWRVGAMINGQKIGVDGKPVGSRLTLATAGVGSVYDFRTAFDGTNHLFVWQEYRSAPNYYDIYARRVDKAGAPVDAANVAITSDNQYDYTPRVAYDGTNFLVGFRRNTSLMVRRMSPGGALLDAQPIAAATGSFSDYQLASDGAGSLALSGEYSGSSLTANDIRGVQIAKAPAANAPLFPVSKAANAQTDPSAAFDGTFHHVVWLDTRDGRPAIYGAVVAPDGASQATTQLVSQVKYTSFRGGPRIAGGAAGKLLVFTAVDSTLGRTVVRGLRLDAQGQPVGGEIDIRVPQVGVTENAFDPAVSFDGTNFLVVWPRQTDEGYGVVGVRVPAAGGAPLDQEPLRLSSTITDGQQLTPSLGFDGTSYFLAWVSSRFSPAGIQVSHIYGTRISKEGSPLDGELVVCDAFLLQRSPQVAGDTKNGGFFVVWEDYRKALDSADVYGTRISAGGQNVDGASGMMIAAGTHDESRPTVAASGDGTNWVVAWRDLRNKQNYDLYGAWVSTAGKVHDAEGLALSADPGDEEAPWMSSSGAGKTLLLYQRLDPAAGYGSYRVRARALDGGAALATACTKDDDCASRSCADGVCCATECGGCGVCNVQPGTCTPRPAGSESPTCAGYKCKGELTCPTSCETNDDCTNATCDPVTKTCVTRVLCVDAQTLRDVTGTLTDCAPYTCVGDACRTQCGSVDDCAPGFVCDFGGRCIRGPAPGEGGGCATSGGSGRGALLAGAAWVVAAVVTRRRRARSGASQRA